MGVIGNIYWPWPQGLSQCPTPMAEQMTLAKLSEIQEQLRRQQEAFEEQTRLLREIEKSLVRAGILDAPSAAGSTDCTKGAVGDLER